MDELTKDELMLERIQGADRVSDKMIHELRDFLDDKNKLDDALEFISVNYPKHITHMTNKEIKDAFFEYMSKNVITYNCHGHIHVE